eukprot:SAG31_NODE_46223_length_255_cov_0.961538_1_plen_21_part_10
MYAACTWYQVYRDQGLNLVAT